MGWRCKDNMSLLLQIQYHRGSGYRVVRALVAHNKVILFGYQGNGSFFLVGEDKRVK